MKNDMASTKKIIKMIIKTLLLIFVSVPFLMTLFVLINGVDYEIPMPNGYEIVRFHSESNGLVSPSDSVVIAPTVVNYAIRGEYVVGYTKKEVSIEDGGIPVGPARYFIADTKNDHIVQGLAKDAWVKALEERNIDGDIELKRVQRPVPFWFQPVVYVYYRLLAPFIDHISS